MHVVGHDGAGVEGVTGGLNGGLEAGGDGVALVGGEGDGWEMEDSFGGQTEGVVVGGAGAGGAGVGGVGGPKRRSSQEAMKSDQEPRGSLGSQKP